MSERFFVESPINDDCDRVVMEGTEGHHLVRVMRKREGDEVVLFDGLGSEFTAVIESIKRDRAELSIHSRHVVDRERVTRIQLAVAMPKGDRQKVLIEQAVETGVHRLLPIQSARSQQSYSNKSIDRWKRYVIEASKQCRRNRLMSINEIVNFDELIQSSNSSSRWIAHPYDEGVASTAPSDLTPETDVVITIGPEGGFTNEEVELASQHGWKRLELGPRILRVETAAVAAVCQFDAWK